MKMLNLTEAARNFSSVVDEVEVGQEEIWLMRNHKPVVRVVPEPQAQNALKFLGDLYRTLDDGTADAVAEEVDFSKRADCGTLTELRNPWAF